MSYKQLPALSEADFIPLFNFFPETVSLTRNEKIISKSRVENLVIPLKSHGFSQGCGAVAKALFPRSEPEVEAGVRPTALAPT